MEEERSLIQNLVNASQQYGVATTNEYLLQPVYEAARTGDVNALSNILSRDPHIAQRFGFSSSMDSPVHVAALYGHADFIKLLLDNKHELAHDRNQQGCTPLHLAANKGYDRVVRILLFYGHPNSCLERDRDGYMAHHWAAARGRKKVLRELLYHRHREQVESLDLEAIHTVPLLREMVMGQTAMHLCIRYNTLDELRLLVEFAEENGEAGVLNLGDLDGNTLLHLAIIDKQYDTTHYLLLKHEVGRIQMNRRNNNGLTPLDIVDQCYPIEDFQSREIRNLLVRKGYMGARQGEGQQPGTDVGIAPHPRQQEIENLDALWNRPAKFFGLLASSTLAYSIALFGGLLGKEHKESADIDKNHAVTQLIISLIVTLMSSLTAGSILYFGTTSFLRGSHRRWLKVVNFLTYVSFASMAYSLMGAILVIRLEYVSGRDSLAISALFGFYLAFLVLIPCIYYRR